MSRHVWKRRAGKAAKWFSIAFFMFITVFPFYWMLNLSLRPFQDVLTDPTRLFPCLEDIQTDLRPLRCVFGDDVPERYRLEYRAPFVSVATGPEWRR